MLNEICADDKLAGCGMYLHIKSVESNLVMRLNMNVDILPTFLMQTGSTFILSSLLQT